MRVDDGAYPGSNNALQLHSAAESPTGTAMEGRRLGTPTAWSPSTAFNGAEGITVMGWFKMRRPTEPDRPATTRSASPAC